MAFSFEFIARKPYKGLAMTNTQRPHVPDAKVVYSDDFFTHMYTVGYNAILRVHADKDAPGLATQIPFVTTMEPGPCSNWPEGWHHTAQWTCATIKGDVLLGKQHKIIANDENLLRANCSLFVDLHTPY